MDLVLCSRIVHSSALLLKVVELKVPPLNVISGFIFLLGHSHKVFLLSACFYLLLSVCS